MTDGPTVDPELAALRDEVARLRADRALGRAIDDRLEEGLKERQPLERVVPALLDILCAHLGARGAALRTLDESLSERVFTHGDAPVTRELLDGAEAGTLDEPGIAAHRLDVAGEDFGVALCFLGEGHDDVADRLEIFCESLDNHLAAIAQARRKYEVIRSISDALKEPVLERGITRAIEIVRRQVGFENLVLLFRHEDDLEAGALRYKVYRDGALLHDSAAPSDREVDGFLRANAAAFLDGDDDAVRARFGITRYREEVLITGVRATRVIGRMLVTSELGEFHTYDRELLDRFADYLRQRIVDFNREWKQLALVFDTSVCERLLREEGYAERWLTPRERDTAILFGDIAGFTRVSEQILKRPEAIGRLIDTWVEGAVRILWETGGAFDKMIGDCVIGLWGPPFFDMDPKEACARALEAATRIRELTKGLVHDAALPELADTPALDVAIGLNFCPLSVGLFGPSDDYTGFSSGMNSTARLQGVATGGEILCMQSFADALGEDARFGEPRRVAVKNVAEPLVFRALR